MSLYSALELELCRAPLSSKGSVHFALLPRTLANKRSISVDAAQPVLSETPVKPLSTPTIQELKAQRNSELAAKLSAPGWSYPRLTVSETRSAELAARAEHWLQLNWADSRLWHETKNAKLDQLRAEEASEQGKKAGKKWPLFGEGFARKLIRFWMWMTWWGLATDALTRIYGRLFRATPNWDHPTRGAVFGGAVLAVSWLVGWMWWKPVVIGASLLLGQAPGDLLWASAVFFGSNGTHQQISEKVEKVEKQIPVWVAYDGIRELDGHQATPVTHPPVWPSI